MADLKNLEKLQRLFNLMDDDALTKEQFKRAFEKVISLMQKQDAERNKMMQELAKFMKKAKDELDSTNSTDRKTVNSELKKLEKQYTADVNSMNKLFSLTRKQLEAMIPAEYNDEYLREEIADSLASLKKEIPEIPEAFDATEIIEKLEELEKKCDTLSKRPTGGGVTNARIEQAFKYILKTETPSGLINGSNTEYTVTSPIFAVFAFSLNGEVVPQIPNYTINGNKITFSTALPAAYSGKDFEIKYV